MLMITTKKGDKGISEYFGKRVLKSGKFLEALGTLDELQAVVELVSYKSRETSLVKVSEDLSLIMGNLGREIRNQKLDLRIKEIEKEIDNLKKELKPENKFVIFEDKKARELNWVRTIVRRAERKVAALQNYQLILIYLNRLSDFIYLLALKEEE